MPQFLQQLCNSQPNSQQGGEDAGHVSIVRFFWWCLHKWATCVNKSMDAPGPKDVPFIVTRSWNGAIGKNPDDRKLVRGIVTTFAAAPSSHRHEGDLGSSAGSK